DRLCPEPARSSELKSALTLSAALDVLGVGALELLAGFSCRYLALQLARRSEKRSAQPERYEHLVHRKLFDLALRESFEQSAHQNVIEVAIKHAACSDSW